MSRILVLSVIVASLSTIVGCGASRSSAAAPSTANVAEARDEASWTPPDELAVSFASSAKETKAVGSPAKAVHSYRPNRLDRPTRGAVHAATY